MEPICGPRLEIDEPTAQERAWIFQALQKPEIHLPLSCPRAPTQELFDEGRIETVERGERGALMARLFIGRHRQSKQPRVFFLDFGWSGAFDVVRDLDLSIPEPGSGMWTYLEANLMIVTYLFRHGLARRARWRIAEARFDGTGWFDRRCVSCFSNLVFSSILNSWLLFFNLLLVIRYSFIKLMRSLSVGLFPGKLSHAKCNHLFGRFLISHQNMEKLCFSVAWSKYDCRE